MELFLIYAWLKLDIFLFIGFCILIAYCGGMLIFLACTKIEKWDDDSEIASKNELRKKYKPHPILSGLVFFILLATPSSKDTAILVASSYALDFSKSSAGEKVKSLLLQKAENILDDELKKTKVK